MSKKIDEIFGEGAIERARKIPGQSDAEYAQVRYVSYDGKAKPANLFRAVVRKISPPLMTGGGVVLEGCTIAAPDGLHFYSLYFRGDVEGWANQIEQGATALGLLTARVAGDVLNVSDGRSFPLRDCQVEFD